jgi:hypothetical protein
MPPNAPSLYAVAFQAILTDPVLLVGMLLPFLFVGILLYHRMRVSRRLTAMSDRNAKAMDENIVRWERAGGRTEKMIGLLTEIRDHLSRMAPPAPAAAPEQNEPDGKNI